MGNIVGEPTRKYVTSQVALRQNIHGSINRTTEQLLYLNSKTAFVKLASSVDITDDVKGFNLGNGSELAKKYVLFNGTTEIQPTTDDKGNITTTTTQRAGIARNGDFHNSNAYGIGGTEFGLSPMMGITQVNVKSENRGSLRTATVDIIANNRNQFEIIETLYLKLGYTMLLEWGWSSYFDSSGYVDDSPHSLVPQFLLRTKGYDDLLNLIEEERWKSEGNYDAFLGKVVNFSWKFTPEGKYQVTLILRSAGDVVESLKMNVLTPSDNKELSKEIQKKKEEAKAADDNYKSATALQFRTENIFANDMGLQKTLPPPSAFKEGQAIQIEKPEPSVQDLQQDSLNALNEANKALEELNELMNQRTSIHKELARLEKLFKPGIGYLNTTYGSVKKISVIKQQYSGGGDDKSTNSIFYIRFKYLLEFIQNSLIPSDKKFGDRFVNFDLNALTNLIILPPSCISGDPTKCNFQIEYGDEKETTLWKAEPFKIEKGKNSYGKLMNIYFSHDFIRQILDSSPQQLVLVDFLQQLMDAYCYCTGNYNNISVTVDSDTNQIKFIDESSSSADSDINKETETANFVTYGYFNGNASFIRNLDFTTTISPELSTMITIGATSEGYYPGYDATGLSSINYGTKDYTKEELLNGKLVDQNQEQEQKEIDLAESKYKQALEARDNYIKKIIGDTNVPSERTLDAEDINVIPNILKTIQDYQQSEKAKNERKNNKLAASPNIGFIPFDLSLTLDGISGFRIYNKIKLEQDFLPLNYPNALKFIIKGVDHTIAQNSWTTSLSTLAVPANGISSQKTPKLKTSKSQAAKSEFTGPTPNADKLRELLTSLGYSEKGKELSNGGDISTALLNYASSVFKEIKSQFPDIGVKVTGGNDLYHQQLSYRSSHTEGQGLDFVIDPLTTDNKNKIDTLLGGFAAGNQDKVVSFINEYDYPSSAATAGHFHIRIGGKIESKRIANFVAAASDGKLKTYNIA